MCKFNSIQCNAVQFNSSQFNAICNAIQLNSLQCNSIQLHSPQFNRSAIQFNSTQRNSMPTNNQTHNQNTQTSKQTSNNHTNQANKTHQTRNLVALQPPPAQRPLLLWIVVGVDCKGPFLHMHKQSFATMNNLQMCSCSSITSSNYILRSLVLSLPLLRPSAISCVACVFSACIAAVAMVTRPSQVLVRAALTAAGPSCPLQSLLVLLFLQPPSLLFLLSLLDLFHRRCSSPTSWIFLELLRAQQSLPHLFIV